MNTLEAIQTRRSIRKFSDKLIPEETLEKILEAGTWAPTAMGRQSPVMVAVTNRADRDALSQMNAAVMGHPGMDPFYGCPTVVVVLAERSFPPHVYDGSLVCGTLMLAATDLGVDSIWIHRAKEEFDSEEGKALLKKWGVEGDYEGVGHICLGYGIGEKPAPAPRKADYIYRVK